MNQGYKNAMAVDRLSREQVADVLVDFKWRIQCDFFIIEQDNEKIVLGNRDCPLADKVIRRPALCMMTSNIFGSIAQNLGYSKVVIKKAITRGDLGCKLLTFNRHRRPRGVSTSRDKQRL
jgi:hypothetical protein